MNKQWQSDIKKGMLDNQQGSLLGVTYPNL